MNFQVQNISKILHLLCRVAGYKYVMKHLLHEVHHLEGCLFMLKRQVGCSHRMLSN